MATNAPRCRRRRRATARRAFALALLTASAALTACLPSRIAIDLAPGDGEFAESVVLGGAPSSSPKVALIDVTGFISHTAGPGLIAGRANAIDSLVARLDKAGEDPKVRAVVLRINSPGGTVAASQTAYDEVVAFRERTGKPVVVSMGDVATSGGYYLALAGDRIVAQPASITGSVGVLFQTFNVSRGLDMIGIEGRAIVSKPNKDLANPFEPEDPAHIAILQGMVDGFYDDFRALVIDSREGLSASDIDTVTDGRVFTGRQALDLALIDQLGSVRDAFEAAKDLASLDAATLVKYHVEGDVITTPYASASFDGAHTPPGVGTQVNLFQVNVPELPTTGGFYYLWQP